MQNAAFAYLKTNVTTTSQGDLLLMLYDAAIKFLKQAKEKIQIKDYAAKGNLISKAMDIIAELNGSLNKEKGGDLAQNLTQLYFYCNTKLLQANLKLDPQRVDEVIGILDGLRSAFASIMDNEEVKQIQAESRPKPTASMAGTMPAFTPPSHGFAPPRPKINPYAKPGPAAQANPTPPPAAEPETETQPAEAKAEAKPKEALTLDLAKAKAKAAAKTPPTPMPGPAPRSRAAQAYANLQR